MKKSKENKKICRKLQAWKYISAAESKSWSCVARLCDNSITVFIFTKNKRQYFNVKTPDYFLFDWSSGSQELRSPTEGSLGRSSRLSGPESVLHCHAFPQISSHSISIILRNLHARKQSIGKPLAWPPLFNLHLTIRPYTEYSWAILQFPQWQTFFRVLPTRWQRKPKTRWHRYGSKLRYCHTMYTHGDSGVTVTAVSSNGRKLFQTYFWLPAHWIVHCSGGKHHCDASSMLSEKECTSAAIHGVKWRHRIYGHDTFAILWV